MSIEAKIDALIAALNANTAARLKAGDASPAATSTSPAAATEKRGPGRPPKASAAPVPTVEQVVEAANRFMEAFSKAETRALLSKHGSENGSTAKLPEAKRAAFIAAVNETLVAQTDEPESTTEDEDDI